jgi:hypothetical protein
VFQNGNVADAKSIFPVVAGTATREIGFQELKPASAKLIAGQS